MSRDRAAGAVVACLILAFLAPGCGKHAGPPGIALGTPCATCGMDVEDLRFACESGSRGVYRVYDSIECLIRDRDRPSPAAIYLADHDRKSLHAVDSLWIVKGSFPTPMDGGLAAFLDRSSAEDVASTTRGRVGRWADIAALAPELAP